MTLKQKSCLPNGSRLSVHGRRRRVKVGATSKSWWRFACHEGAVHHQHTSPDQKITKEYYIEVFAVWETQWKENRRSCAQVVTGSFIATMYRHILQLSCRPFFLQNTASFMAVINTTPQIWFFATSDFTQRYNRRWKVGDMWMRRTHSKQVQSTTSHCRLTSPMWEWLFTDAQ